jgi:signal transduction histidine kinase
MSEQEVISGFGGRAAVTLGVLILALLPIAGHKQAHVWVFVGAAVFALTVGAVLLRWPARVPLLVLDCLLVVADLLLVYLGQYDGALQIAFPGVYLIIGTIVFAVRGWLVSTAHLCLLGASYGGVLAVGPHEPAPVARWVIVMTIVVVVGVFIRWLVSTATGIAVAEHAARDLAEFAAAELERESRARSRFLARMSHELRTPLNVVLGFADLLGEQLAGPLNGKQQEYVRDVSDSARHLVALVDDVLDLDHVERGDVRLTISRADIANVFSDSVVMIRDRAMAKNIDFVVDIAPRLGLVECDQLKIRQVVVNLLANAVQYTPAGGRIELRAFERANRVHVEVDDTGPGVLPADRDRIFEEFGQAEGTDTGTGLGLALARKFVELHGGTIWMQSRPAGGSSFRFWVPRTASAAAALAVADGERDADADYSAFIRPGSRANRELLGRIGPRMFMVSGLMWGTAAIFMPVAPHVRLEVGAAGIIGVVASAFIGPMLTALTFRQIELFGWFGAIAVSVLTYFGGPFKDVVPFMYAWITMITFALWPRRNVQLQFVGIGVCYGAVLIALDAPQGLAHWVGLMILLAFNAETVSWVTRRLRALIVAEQDAHRQARQVRAQLSAAAKHKTSFVANMSHELRTPLNAVIGFTELLGSELVGPLNEHQQEYVRDIDDAARHLLTIINNVLDSAKLRAGQLTLSLDVVPIRALLERAVEHGNPPGPAQLHDVHLSIEPGIEYVVADRQRLEQVLVHLVSNAVKFSPSGGRVVVTARRAALDELHISVADSGIGILPSQYERIFDEFHQASQPTDHLPAGTGLGLSLARGLVEMHGGRIWVTSRPDGGSTFTVALPASATSVKALEEIVRAT